MQSKSFLKIFRPTIEIFYAFFSIFILIFLLLYLADANFSLAFKGFVNSSIGGRNNAYLFSTFSKMALISGMAIAALVAFRGGLFNIGGEGQLVVGGFACAFTGLLVSDLVFSSFRCSHFPILRFSEFAIFRVSDLHTFRLFAIQDLRLFGFPSFRLFI